MLFIRKICSNLHTVSKVTEEDLGWNKINFMVKTGNFLRLNGIYITKLRIYES